MTFIKFLEQQYIDLEHPLNDDMADGFPDWFSLQDIEEVCKMAEEWKSIEVEELRKLIPVNTIAENY